MGEGVGVVPQCRDMGYTDIVRCCITLPRDKQSGTTVTPFCVCERVSE